jgi:hypothetical protein
MPTNDPRSEHSALLPVDIPPDFRPGGALAQARRLSIMEPIGRLAARLSCGGTRRTMPKGSRTFVPGDLSRPTAPASDERLLTASGRS